MASETKYYYSVASKGITDEEAATSMAAMCFYVLDRELFTEVREAARRLDSGPDLAIERMAVTITAERVS